MKQAGCMTEVRRLLLRPWQDSAFRVLALAMFVAALSITAVLLLRAELDTRFDQRSAQVLGGDLRLESARDADPEQIHVLDSERASRNVRFRSVLVSEEHILLVGVKAVDAHWPLYGHALIANSRFGPSLTMSRGPEPGEAWVAEQVLDRMQLTVGDDITVGSLNLPITAIIRQEPDQGAGFYSMTPRVLMNLEDMPATEILGEGSRARFTVSVRTQASDVLKQQLEPTLRPDQELETVADRQRESFGPLKQLTLWISLAVMLISLLCGAAIYLTMSLRVARRARLSALLRTFGASRRYILTRLLGEEFIAILPPVAAGITAGFAATIATRILLDWQEPLAASAQHWGAILAAPFALFAAFALPRLSALVQVPAMQVLNRNATGSLQRQGLELTAALLGPVILSALLIGSLGELLTLLLLLAGLGALLPLLLWPLLRALERVANRTTVTRRLAIRRLSRRPATTLPLLAALSLAITILTLAGLTGSGLLTDWREKLPERAPNHFVINLFDADLPVLREWQQQQQAIAEPQYPIVRGRLTAINGSPVTEAVTKESDRAERALNRDLALTEGDVLPASNQIAAGDWHAQRSGEVSVESELAEALQLSLGDQLTFVTSRGELIATVSSFRDVDWESFAPNFYFMFSANELAGQDVTWLTSFWLAPGDGQRLAQLMQQLPHITLFDVNALLDQAQEVVAQASQASAVLATLLISASLLVLSAALLATARQRQADQALLRVFGARQSLLSAINRLEFLALGLLAACVATIIVVAALIPLANMLFDGDLPAIQWLALPWLLGLLIALFGLANVQAQNTTPAQLLQDN